MTSEEMRILRGYASARRDSAVGKVRQFVDCLGHCLVAYDDRVMPPPAMSEALSRMVDELAQPHAPLADAARSMLAELAKISVSGDELTVLVGGVGALRALGVHEIGLAIDAALRCITEGVGLTADARRQLDDFAASECDSVSLAVTSLLRAVDAREAFRG